MNLRYIHIGDVTYYLKNNEFASTLAYHSNFICNYVCKQIRKDKIETDGTYNGLFAELCSENEIQIKFTTEQNMIIQYPFDKSLYLQMNEEEKYEFYISVMNGVYQYIAEIKGLPMNAVSDICNRFRANGYKNEWVHKKKFIKEYGVNVILNCYLTSQSFRLELVLIRKKDKVVLAKGDVFETLPDEIFFAKSYRDIIIEGDYIQITDFLDRPYFQLSIQDLLEGNFKVANLRPNAPTCPSLSDEQLRILFE